MIKRDLPRRAETVPETPIDIKGDTEGLDSEIRTLVKL